MGLREPFPHTSQRSAGVSSELQRNLHDVYDKKRDILNRNTNWGKIILTARIQKRGPIIRTSCEKKIIMYIRCISIMSEEKSELLSGLEVLPCSSAQGYSAFFSCTESHTNCYVAHPCSLLSFIFVLVHRAFLSTYLKRLKKIA